MDKETFIKELTDKLKKIGIYITNEKIEKFYTYMQELIEWNNKMNLTAITEPKEIIMKHFVDSLTILNYTKDKDSLIDIGTGAGFPGIPLKIMNDNIKITLLDSLNKRLIFLEDIIEKLNLKNILTLHSRAEDAGLNSSYREKYDVAVSRAVAPLNVLLEYMVPMVKVGGICICMKGNNGTEEIKNAQNAIKELGVKIEEIKEFKLPDTDIIRSIIVLKKEKSTSSKFPRKAGIPVKKPL